jgi:hypothetical protein
MRYAVEMGSDAVIIYIHTPSFVKICSGIRKLIRGLINTQTSRKIHKPTFILAYLPYFEKKMKIRFEITMMSVCL